MLSKGWEAVQRQTKESFQGALNHRINSPGPASQKKQQNTQFSWVVDSTTFHIIKYEDIKFIFYIFSHTFNHYLCIIYINKKSLSATY